MKKWIALLLAASMLLSLAACGSASTPAQTTVATTEPAHQATEAPTEAPTEPPVIYTPYELSEGETYTDALKERGFAEIDLSLSAYWAEVMGAANAADARATPISLEFSENGFRMEVDYAGVESRTNTVMHLGTVEVFGAKTDSIENISGINSKDYLMVKHDYHPEEFCDINKHYRVGNMMISDISYYYNRDEAGNICDVVYNDRYYYIFTGNTYNIISHIPDGKDWMLFPTLLPEYSNVIPFVPQVQTLTYGDFTFEMSQFAIDCDNTRYVFDYRPGMTLSAWACSELNTSGWIPWFDDTVLSPDRKYICSTDYLAIEECDTYAPGTLLAFENDGRVNYFSNTTLDTDAYTEEQLLAMELEGNDGISVTVAHMVNAKTPLVTPGFRIVGSSEGRAAYHSVEMGDGLYLLDDILDIYMNGIADELIPHIKLYAFPESQEFLDSIQGNTILNAHRAPPPQGQRNADHPRGCGLPDL